MQKELRNKRINVRATNRMVERLKGIKCYLNSYSYICLSDSETVEALINYFYDKNSFEDFRFYLANNEMWREFEEIKKNSHSKN